MMMKWWQSLATRERRMIFGGAIVALILLFYTLILNPLNTAITNLQNEIQTQRSLIRWMQQADAHILQLRHAGFTTEMVSTHHQTMLILAERALTDVKLNRYLQNVQQPQSQMVMMHFHQVPFDDLLLWIQQLSHHYHINVQQFSAIKTQPIGTADVTVTLHSS